MMFRLEAEAYEKERLDAMQTSIPTPTNHNDEPPIADTTEARQEEPALEEIPTEPTTTTTTVPNSEATEDGPREGTTPPDSAAQPPSPTPQPEQPDQNHAPGEILDILEEE